MCYISSAVNKSLALRTVIRPDSGCIQALWGSKFSHAGGSFFAISQVIPGDRNEEYLLSLSFLILASSLASLKKTTWQWSLIVHWNNLKHILSTTKEQTVGLSVEGSVSSLILGVKRSHNENTLRLFCFLFFFIQSKAPQGIKIQTSNNYSPKWRWLVVDVYSCND